MILAAGLGTRMRPLTLDRAKPVLPVLDRPLLHWTLEMLAGHGVKDVMINLHYLPRTVRAAVGDGRAFGLRVAYSFEREILGTGGGPRKVRRWIGDETLLILNGDVVFDFDLTALRRRHERAGAPATLALIPNPDPRHYSPVVRAATGGWSRWRGCPRPTRGTVSLFTGVHVLEAELLDRLPRRASDTVRHLYVPLIAEGRPPLGVRVRGPWYDLGGPSLYLASRQSLLASRSGESGGGRSSAGARVRPRARVVRSVVGRGRSSRRAPRCGGACCGIASRWAGTPWSSRASSAAGVKVEDGEALRSRC